MHKDIKLQEMFNSWSAEAFGEIEHFQLIRMGAELCTHTWNCGIESGSEKWADSSRERPKEMLNSIQMWCGWKLIAVRHRQRRLFQNLPVVLAHIILFKYYYISFRLQIEFGCFHFDECMCMIYGCFTFYNLMPVYFLDPCNPLSLFFALMWSSAPIGMNWKCLLTVSLYLFQLHIQ